MPLPSQQQIDFVRKYIAGAGPVAPNTSPEDVAELFASFSASEQENWLNENRSWLKNTSLIAGDLSKVFDQTEFRDLPEIRIAGTGTPQLAELMKRFEDGVYGDDRAAAIKDLSELIGETEKRLAEDYATFLMVRAQQEVIGEDKGKEKVPPLDKDRHPDFRASQPQMMFGAVLGEAFDIHPVFAALLSPTGGLVGAGNKFMAEVPERLFGIEIPQVAQDFMKSIPSFQLDPENPLGLHGTVHDAAGYLKTYHDEGKGYNYLDKFYEKILFGADSPFAGQISGTYANFKENFDEYAAAKTDEAVVLADKGLQSARDGVTSYVDQKIAAYEAERAKDNPFLNDTVEDALEKIADGVVFKLADGAKGATDLAASTLRAGAIGAGAAGKIAVELMSATKHVEGELKSFAFKTGNAIGEVIVDTYQSAKDISTTVEDAKSELIDEAENLREGLADAGTALFMDVAVITTNTSARIARAESPEEVLMAMEVSAADLATAIGNCGDDAKQEILDAAENAGQIVSDAVDDIKSEVIGFGRDLEDVADKTADAYSKIARNIFDDVTEATSDCGKAVEGALNMLANPGREAAAALQDTPVYDAIEGKFDALRNFIWD